VLEPTSIRWRRIRGGLFAAVAAELAALGHLVGGGEFPHPSTVLAAGALIGLGAAGLARQRRGFGPILGLLVASQLLFPALFSLSGHAEALDLPRMTVFHLVAAVASAAVLAGGERALFRCARLWRRVVGRLVGPAPRIATGAHWASRPAGGLNDLLDRAVRANGRRGPPRPRLS
jgi:hypothetical protein